MDMIGQHRGDQRGRIEKGFIPIVFCRDDYGVVVPTANGFTTVTPS